MIEAADEFPDAGLNDDLTFVAWQDQPPRHGLHAAHDLAQAATGLGFHHLTWVEADRVVWARYGQDLAGERPDRAAGLAVYRATATLHRVYAFWHLAPMGAQTVLSHVIWPRKSPLSVPRMGSTGLVAKPSGGGS